MNGDDLWEAAKIICEKNNSERIKRPPISERFSLIEDIESVDEQYVKEFLEKWYKGNKPIKLNDRFINALYDSKIAEFVFDAALKKAYKNDEILLYEENKDYLQSDLLKIILHEKSGAHGSLIKVDLKKKKLKILNARLEFRKAPYKPKGDLREEGEWAQYF